MANHHVGTDEEDSFRDTASAEVPAHGGDGVAETQIWRDSEQRPVGVGRSGMASLAGAAWKSPRKIPGDVSDDARVSRLWPRRTGSHVHSAWTQESLFRRHDRSSSCGRLLSILVLSQMAPRTDQVQSYAPSAGDGR